VHFVHDTLCIEVLNVESIVRMNRDFFSLPFMAGLIAGEQRYQS